MKIDINKQYKTYHGRDVKIYTTEHEGRFPVVGAIGKRIYEWTAKGYSPNAIEQSLVEVKPEKAVWVVIDDRGYVDAFDFGEGALLHKKNYGGTLYRVTLTDDMVVE